MHVVDRIALNAGIEELRDYWLDVHAQHASVAKGGIRPDKADLLPSVETNDPQGLRMVGGATGEASQFELALLSVRSVKV